jgi:aryl-alcohol dehydrogenase-like predicted oxidoreductase
MVTRKLGNTGIEVTEVGLGCWALGGASFRGGQPTGWSGANIGQSLETVRRAWELGVRFYDTADAYGRGKSEVLVGMGLHEHKGDAVIATKVGNSLAAPGQFWSEPYIRGGLDASLTRLEVDCVDVYQLHGPKVEMMTDDLFALMRDLKASGKVRSWGVSIGSAEEGERAIEGGAEVIQLVYNILQQETGKRIFPLAKEKGVGIIVRVPLASGWLTGKYDANTVFPSDDHRSGRYTADRVKETAEKVARLDFLLEEAETLAEAALRFTLMDPAVSTVIPGGKAPAQVADNVKAAGNPLSEGAMKRIQELFG